MISASVLDGLQAQIAAQGVKVEEMVEEIAAEKKEAPKATRKRAPKAEAAETAEKPAKTAKKTTKAKSE